MALLRRTFRNKRSFVHWFEELLNDSRIDRDRTVIYIGYDHVSWSICASVGPDSELPDWAYHSLPIPKSKSDAIEIWNAIQEQQLCLFYHQDSPVGTVFVAARHGMWNSIDDKFMPFRKATFREISYDEARLMVNDSIVWSQISGEVQLFGIACRILVK